MMPGTTNSRLHRTMNRSRRNIAPMLRPKGISPSSAGASLLTVKKPRQPISRGLKTSRRSRQLITPMRRTTPPSSVSMMLTASRASGLFCTVLAKSASSETACACSGVVPSASATALMASPIWS